MHMLAIDLGKQSFHIYRITDDGEVVSRKVGRAKLVDAVTRLRPQLVAMEACASSHHWGWSRSCIAGSCFRSFRSCHHASSA